MKAQLGIVLLVLLAGCGERIGRNESGGGSQTPPYVRPQEDPSLLGKLKTSIQFLAILLAILRPGDEIAGAYLDEWVMLVAAAITVASAVDYLARSASSLRGR